MKIDITQIRDTVLRNCDISDATYSGIYSICTLALRLRDLLKWERGLAPWEEEDANDTLDWIGDKEEKWAEVTGTEFIPLSINGHSFDAFDTEAINRALQPQQLFYGAGYAHGLKPTFFLAHCEKTELLNRIAILLGGRAAEEVIFEDISTGAHNDLGKATDIARSMVKEYGMSAKIGQVYFSREKQPGFLNVPGFQGAVEYSEATAEMIDSEVREIIGEQYRRALDILSSKKSLLTSAATLLLEKETIEGAVLKKLKTQNNLSEVHKETR